MAGAETDWVSIQVAYARPERQAVWSLYVPVGTTARTAVRQAGLEALFPEIDPNAAPLGIYGRHVEDEHVLRSGDRVEIYRPLEVDPREARRQRARVGQGS